MAIGTRVEGLTKVVRGLEQLGVSVDDLKDGMAAIAAKGAGYAAGFAPRLSGRLKGTIRGNRAKNKAVVTAGRASVPYAGPQNYGWPARNIKASQFMQRADARLEPEAVQLLEQALNDAVRKAGLD